MCSLIYEQIDTLFNAKVSEVIFQGASPLTICEDGEYYIEKVLGALLPLVTERIENNSNKALERTSKYTAKYIKEDNK